MKSLSLLLTSHGYDRSSEADLQAGIQETLQNAGVPAEREYELTDSDRIDFYIRSMSIGIEVKMAGSQAAVLHQLWRYAKSPEIEGLMLVTTRSQLRAMPAGILGKPLQVVSLAPF